MGSTYLVKHVIILLILGAFQCRTPVKSQSPVDEVIRSKIGSSYTKSYNDSKTLALYVQEFPARQQGTSKVKFVVVELHSNQILEEGNYLNGHVKWHDDTSLEVLDIPGVSKKGQSTHDFKKVIYLKDATPQKH